VVEIIPFKFKREINKGNPNDIVTGSITIRSKLNLLHMGIISGVGKYKEKIEKKKHCKIYMDFNYEKSGNFIELNFTGERKFVAKELQLNWFNSMQHKSISLVAKIECSIKTIKEIAA